MAWALDARVFEYADSLGTTVLCQRRRFHLLGSDACRPEHMTCRGLPRGLTLWLPRLPVRGGWPALLQATWGAAQVRQEEPECRRPWGATVPTNCGTTLLRDFSAII